MRKILREQRLGIYFVVLFVLALWGQSLAGLGVYNQDQLAHGSEGIDYWDFVTSSNSVVDMAEN